MPDYTHTHTKSVSALQNKYLLQHFTCAVASPPTMQDTTTQRVNVELTTNMFNQLLLKLYVHFQCLNTCNRLGPIDDWIGNHQWTESITIASSAGWALTLLYVSWVTSLVWSATCIIAMNRRMAGSFNCKWDGIICFYWKELILQGSWCHCDTTNLQV